MKLNTKIIINVFLIIINKRQIIGKLLNNIIFLSFQIKSKKTYGNNIQVFFDLILLLNNIITDFLNYINCNCNHQSYLTNLLPHHILQIFLRDI